MEFLVVCDVNKVSEDICDELNSVPVVLQHVTSAKKKNAADEKLRQVRTGCWWCWWSGINSLFWGGFQGVQGY